MNPNNEFGKIIPGVNEDGGFIVAGIGNGLRRLMDGLGLIETSPYWTDTNIQAMQAWAADFVAWMETSAKGQKEFLAKGNHGTNYDMIATVLALYAGDLDAARRHVEHYLTRVPVQFSTDGTQPLEMIHANNLLYSYYNLQVAADIADLARQLGVDVWNYRTDDGQELRSGIEFLIPFFTDNRAWDLWPGESFPLNRALYHDLLQRAAVAYNSPEYLTMADSLAGDGYSSRLTNLTHPEISVASTCSPE